MFRAQVPKLFILFAFLLSFFLQITCTAEEKPGLFDNYDFSATRGNRLQQINYYNNTERKKTKASLQFIYNTQTGLLEKTELALRNALITDTDISKNGVSYWKVKDTRTNTEISAYDAEDKIIAGEVWNHDGTSLYKKTYVHTKNTEENTRVETTRNSTGDIVNREIQSYNARGDILLIERQNEKGDTLYRESHSYDENGNELTLEQQNVTGDIFYSEKNSYDGNGNRLTLERKGSAGDIIDSYNYFYDERGRRLSINFTFGGGSFYEGTYSYDKRGNRIGFLIHDQDKNPSYEGIYSYDENGNRLTLEILYLKIRRNYKETSTYDTKGNKLTYEEQDTSGTISKYSYDTDGNIRTFKKQNATGTILNKETIFTVHNSGDRKDTVNTQTVKLIVLDDNKLQLLLSSAGPCYFHYDSYSKRRDFLNCSSYTDPDTYDYYEYIYSQSTNRTEKIIRYSDAALNNRVSTTSYTYNTKAELERKEVQDSSSNISVTCYEREEDIEIKKGFSKNFSRFVIEKINEDCDDDIEIQNIREYNIYGRLQHYYRDVAKVAVVKGKNSLIPPNILRIDSKRNYSYQDFSEYVYENAPCGERDSHTYSSLLGTSYLQQSIGTRLCYNEELE